MVGFFWAWYLSLTYESIKRKGFLGQLERLVDSEGALCSMERVTGVSLNSAVITLYLFLFLRYNLKHL